MTKEKLLERKKDLQGGLEMLNKKIAQFEEEFKKLAASRTANINAIQENDYWLKRLAEEEIVLEDMKVKEDNVIAFPSEKED